MCVLHCREIKAAIAGCILPVRKRRAAHAKAEADHKAIVAAAKAAEAAAMAEDAAEEEEEAEVAPASAAAGGAGVGSLQSAAAVVKKAQEAFKRAQAAAKARAAMRALPPAPGPYVPLSPGEYYGAIPQLQMRFLSRCYQIVPVSTAEVERFFSCCGRVMTFSRNRIGKKKQERYMVAAYKTVKEWQASKLMGDAEASVRAMRRVYGKMGVDLDIDSDEEGEYESDLDAEAVGEAEVIDAEAVGEAEAVGGAGAAAAGGAGAAATGAE